MNLPILSLTFYFVFRAEALAGEIKEFQGQLADYNMVCYQLLILNILSSPLCTAFVLLQHLFYWHLPGKMCWLILPFIQLLKRKKMEIKENIKEKKQGSVLPLH